MDRSRKQRCIRASDMRLKVYLQSSKKSEI